MDSLVPSVSFRRIMTLVPPHPSCRFPFTPCLFLPFPFSFLFLFPLFPLFPFFSSFLLSFPFSFSCLFPFSFESGFPATVFHEGRRFEYRVLWLGIWQTVIFLVCKLRSSYIFSRSNLLQSDDTLQFSGRFSSSTRHGLSYLSPIYG